MNKALKFEHFVYIILFVILALVFRHYSALTSLSNQVSQLPIVMRILDPGFLANDWYTNEMSILNPRTFFAELVAAFARILGLDMAYLCLYLIASALSAGVTYYAVTGVFRASPTAGLIAALFVVALKFFEFGTVLQIVHDDLIPAHIVKPLTLLAILFAMQGRGGACGLLAALASLLQPLLGVCVGIMALGALFAVSVVTIDATWRPKVVIDFARMRSAGLGLLFLTPIIVFWMRLETAPVDLHTYFDIVVNVRNPHHYLPSSWPLEAYLKMIGLAFAIAILFLAWRRETIAHEGEDALTLHSYLLVFAMGLALLCVLGYLLVEIWPVRSFITLQAFRYLYIPVWFGAIFAAISLTHVFEQASFAKRSVFSLLLVGTSGILQPFALLVGAAAYTYWARLKDNRLSLAEAALAVLLFFPIIIEIHGYGTNMPLILFSLLVAATAIFVSTLKQPVVRLALVSCLASVIAIGWLVGGEKADNAFTKIGERFRLYSYPTINLVATNADEFSNRLMGLVEVANYAKGALPQDAIFLTPPDFGAFRIFAERAIVVDFKSWTFRQPQAWYDRMGAVYGDLGGPGGFPLMNRLDEVYQQIGDPAIARISDDYGARYAVLHKSTLTHYPVLFSGELYKIIEIHHL